MAEAFAEWWGVEAHAVLHRLDAAGAEVSSALAEFNCTHDKALLQATRVECAGDSKQLGTECTAMLTQMTRMTASIHKMNRKIASVRQEMEAIRASVSDVRERAFDYIKNTHTQVPHAYTNYTAPPGNIRTGSKLL